MLAAMLAVCSTAIPASADLEVAHTLGDVNGDGDITVSDAVLVARIAAEDSSLTTISQAALNAADVNQDGMTDQGDLTNMLRYIAGLIPFVSGEKDAGPHDYAATNLTENVTKQLDLDAQTAEGFRSAQLDFTANLLKGVAKEKGTADNMLVSPYSVAMALGMTANGAKGETLAEMEKVLGGKLNLKDLNESYLSILQHSPSSENVKTISDMSGDDEYNSRPATLDIADSVWYQKDPNKMVVPEQFLHNMVDYYHAEAYAAENFNLPVIKDINYWVKQKTHGMINGILPEDGSKSYDNMVMVLINALAFEGDWSSPFEDGQVHRKEFTMENGKIMASDMMYDDGNTYYEDEEAIGFKKYYQGYKYSFIGVLPNKDISIADYTKNLDGKKLEAFLNSETHDYDVDYSIPKFKYDFSLSLKGTLIEMGMPTAFDNSKADFTGLCSGAEDVTYIDDVLHKTFIELDQKGTRAAAVTAVLMYNEGVAAPRETKTVILDRPFVYMIYDEEAKLPVFIGSVMQPSEAGSQADS